MEKTSRKRCLSAIILAGTAVLTSCKFQNTSPIERNIRNYREIINSSTTTYWVEKYKEGGKEGIGIWLTNGKSEILWLYDFENDGKLDQAISYSYNSKGELDSSLSELYNFIKFKKHLAITNNMRELYLSLISKSH